MGIKFIDGEYAMATLRAAGAADEKDTCTARGVSERGIDDLHEFGVGGWQGHQRKNT